MKYEQKQYICKNYLKNLDVLQLKKMKVKKLWPSRNKKNETMRKMKYN